MSYFEVLVRHEGENNGVIANRRQLLGDSVTLIEPLGRALLGPTDKRSQLLCQVSQYPNCLPSSSSCLSRGDFRRATVCLLE